MNRFTTFLSSLIFLVLLTGCDGPRNTRHFPSINRVRAQVQEQDNLTVALQLLSDEEAYNYFGLYLSQVGYCGLHLCITNNSADTYVLRPSYLNLTREPGQEIAQLMHYDTYQRVYWLSLPALFLWWQAIPILVVPYGLYWKNYNRKTDEYMTQKTLEHDEYLIIGPYETVQKFIFTSTNQFRPQCTLSLYNETAKKLVSYDINLIKKKRKLKRTKAAQH